MPEKLPVLFLTLPSKSQLWFRYDLKFCHVGDFKNLNGVTHIGN